MTIREAIIKAEADGLTDWNGIIVRACEDTGCTREAATKGYLKVHPGSRRIGGYERFPGQAPPVKVQPPVKSSGRTLDDFRSVYDKDTIIPAKIRAALAELGESWEYESEFVRRAGLSYADLSAYRPMFEAHCIHIRRDDKRAWAGSPQFANRLREML